MKTSLYFLTFSLACSLVLSSCKKDLSCTGCTEENSIINRPPVANAGPDIIIDLPLTQASLNGSASTDPDGNIRYYRWTKLSGPASSVIITPDSTLTLAKDLELGEYHFELKVTDVGGLMSMDTMKVNVKPSVVTMVCGNRPFINANLVPVGNLSVARTNIISASVGKKILFAGGWVSGAHSSRVDIYDITSATWSTAELSEAARDGMTVATVGSKIFFAGGGNNDEIDVTSRIDIYDSETNNWSTAELSQARNYLSAATLGNKIFFAGGGIWGPLFPGALQNYHIGSNVVDIYDNTNDTWTTANLSEGRFELSATTVNNKIYFAGGLQNIFTGSDRIDIFDASTNSWSTSHLQEVKASHGSIAFNNKILWLAGAKNSYQSGYQCSNLVEIRDLLSGVSSFECMTPKAMFETVKKNDDIIFFIGRINGPGNTFDIYNTITNTWSVGVLPFAIQAPTIISVNNIIYVAGGMINGTHSNQVWKLEF